MNWRLVLARLALAGILVFEALALFDLTSELYDGSIEKAMLDLIAFGGGLVLYSIVKWISESLTNERGDRSARNDL